MMNYKTLVAASLMSMALPSFAFAQCTECAIYPEKDPLNKGAQTPAAKMGLVQPGGAAPPANISEIARNANNPDAVSSVNNARAEMAGHNTRRSSHGMSNHAKKDLRSPDSRSQ